MSVESLEEVVDESSDEEAEPAEMGEFSITDELYEISEATNRDGTVDVKVYDFDKLEESEEVRVHFYTPTMDKQSETMDWPRKDSTEYKFVRLCRATVGGLSGAEWLKTDGAHIKADPDNWEIKAEVSTTHQVKESLFGTSISDIGMYVGISLLAIWVLMLAITLVGAPLLGVATLLGIAGAVTGLWKMWVAAFVALIVTAMFVPEE